MLELDLFTMEWTGMIQFDTVSKKILINTDRKEVSGTLTFTKDKNGTIILHVHNEK